MKIFIGILVGLLLAAGIAAGAAYHAFGELGDVGERDRSKDITEVVDVSGFNEIAISGVYEAIVTVGPDFSMSLSGAPEDIERAEIDVVNGKLRLGYDSNRSGKRRLRMGGMTATIAMPALQGVDVSGVGDVKVAGVAADHFKAQLSGVGDLDLSGTCNALTARVSGVGELDAEMLRCKTVDVRVSGVGDASVYASQSAEAHVSGVGAIDIHGSPARVEKNSGFLSNISVK